MFCTFIACGCAVCLSNQVLKAVHLGEGVQGGVRRHLVTQPT
jgi:hypothetical protein